MHFKIRKKAPLHSCRISHDFSFCKCRGIFVLFFSIMSACLSLFAKLRLVIQVVLIGFSADVGYLLGDSKEHCRFLFTSVDSLFLILQKLISCQPTHLRKCSTFKGTRTRAAFVFIIGFWLLDLANNTVQVSLLRLLVCAFPSQCIIEHAVVS